MNLHEYQAKQLLHQYGIPVPLGKPAASVREAVAIAEGLDGSSWMIKAQVYAGGRGKAGGIKRVSSLPEVRDCVTRMLGVTLQTHQTHGSGCPVNVVLVEQPCTIARELYLGAVVDRSKGQVAFMASAQGGMDIEKIAATEPEKILTVYVNPVVGLQSYQCRQLAFGLELDKGQADDLSNIMLSLYRLFIDKDASLLEINPLVVTESGDLLAVDAKINIDDNALFRQVELGELRDPSQEDEHERQAQQIGLSYITLGGNIACMVNGAGLAMATMDLIKLHGGEPANFLDVGGAVTEDKVAEAFKLILSDAKVKAILVNIFGGIVRCDLIAQGIIKAIQEVEVDVPVIVRLEGTNAEQGRVLLDRSGLSLVTVSDLNEAARRAVATLGGGD